MKQVICLITSLLLSVGVYAGQSSITEAEGGSCMGDDKSRKQTESAALQDAKRLAIEFTTTHIESETVIENFELKNDLIKAFAQADVKVLDIISKSWDDPNGGDCVTIRIRAEVIPSKAMMPDTAQAGLLADPSLPLNVKVWTSGETYSDGDVMRIYVQGNKPYYARLVYTDASGNLIQLLPNQHRSKNYFAGGTIYEVPGNEDQFVLSVSAPYGQETLTLYASTNQLGSINTTAAGQDIFLIKDKPLEVAAKTRGISITTGSKAAAAKQRVAEFAEAAIQIVTSQ